MTYGERYPRLLAKPEYADLAAREIDDTPASPEPATEADLRVAMVVELCPSGSGPCGCGSGPPRVCGHPDHPLHVRRQECLACVAPIILGDAT